MEISVNEEGRASLVAAGASGAIVEALKTADDDAMRQLIACVISILALNEEGCASFVAEDACGALVEALKTAD